MFRSKSDEEILQWKQSKESGNLQEKKQDMEGL